MSAATVSSALADARRLGVDPLDAQLLLGRVLGLTRTGLIARDDAVLDSAAMAQWKRWLERRLAGEPIAYLLGEKEFHGLMFKVTPDVLVPRPETELLVDWAVEVGTALASPARLLDLGTGSGAIALAAKHALPSLAVTGTDRSGAALAIAQRNARRLGLEVELLEASWWQGLEGLRFDVVAANPPYVHPADPALAALRHEPREALTPGGDGLDALRAIVDGAADHLVPGGWLLLEHGFDQAEAVRAMLATAGFEAIQSRHDLAGHERSSGGRAPMAAPPATVHPPAPAR